jgi:polyferredoxin
VLITGFAFVLSNRAPFDVEVQRVRGELYQRTVEGLVTNQYEVQILNKSRGLTAYHLDVDSALPLAILSTRKITIPAGARVNLPLILRATPESIVLANTRVTVQLCDVTTGECVADSTSFQGPLR